MARYCRMAYLPNNSCLHSISDQSGAVQACIWKEDEDLIVVFRGSDDPMDWLTNLDSRSNVSGAHEGWMRDYNSISDDLVEYVLEQSFETLYIAGHSLGAALALIFAHEMYPESPPQVYTFGAPRAGNAVLRSWLDHCDIYRFVCPGDPVPHLPPWFLGWRHNGRVFYMGKRLRHRVPILSWIRSVLRPDFFAHSMDTYLTRLETFRS